MIDVSLYIDRLENINLSIDRYLNKLVFSETWHLRIIYDEKIDFPKNYEWVNHDELIEISDVSWDKHEKNGWSKPDKVFSSVELRYLWKQFRPKKILND